MNILITGGASGLGEALARFYLARSHRVLLVDRDEERLASFNQNRFASTCVADFGTSAGIEETLRAAEAFGPADIVYFCAGISATGPFEQLDPALHETLINVNYLAPVKLTQGLVRQELIAQSGRLVYIGSLSSVVGYPGGASYSASKDGLLSYARSLAPALRKKGLFCHMVLPGPLKTPHAARYSPKGSSDKNRLEPDVAAKEIVQAVIKNKHLVYPGGGTKLIAFLGRIFPSIFERIMRKVLYIPLQSQSK